MFSGMFDHPKPLENTSSRNGCLPFVRGASPGEFLEFMAARGMLGWQGQQGDTLAIEPRIRVIAWFANVGERRLVAGRVRVLEAAAR